MLLDVHKISSQGVSFLSFLLLTYSLRQQQLLESMFKLIQRLPSINVIRHFDPKRLFLGTSGQVNHVTDI
jgi:hypothetical protein